MHMLLWVHVLRATCAVVPVAQFDVAGYAYTCAIAIVFSAMDAADPPSYEGGGSHLPPYTEPQTRLQQTEHVDTLKDSRNRIWATLKLQSGARLSEDTLTFIAGDNITGTLVDHDSA